MSKKSKKRISKSSAYFLSIAALLVLASAISYGAMNMSMKDQTNKISDGTEEIAPDAYASISENDIQFIGSSADYVWDTEDPYYGYNKLPVVALVYIDTIDGGRNYSPIFGQYVYTQTIGKMTVLEVYKGDIKAGQQLNYARLGGIISYDDYWNGLDKTQKDKILYQNNGSKPKDKKYVQEKFLDDIDIKAGKKYVVFLQPQTSKNGQYKEYFIDGFEHGLKEAKGSGSDAKVLDAKTNEWKDVKSIVKVSN